MDFVVDQKWYKETLRADYGHQHTELGEDNSNNGGVMDIFLFFQNGGQPPSWILLYVVSDVTARCGLSISTIVPNLVTIAQTAAELKLFFGGISPLNISGYHRDPQKALPCAEPRIFTYRSSKSVNRGDLRARWRNEKKKRKSQTVIFHACAQTTDVYRLLPYLKVEVRSPT